MLRNLLLDWSGTLVDDLPPVLGATNFIFEKYGHPPLDRESFRRHFRLPFTDFYEEFLPEVPLHTLEELFHQRFAELQGEVTPLPGLIEFLDFCKASGRRIFLLSAMKCEHFEVQAQRFGVRQCFEHPYVGVQDKRAQIHDILQHHDLAPEETAFVGDMVHDIETAHHGGIMSIAILTGYDTLEKLAPAQPDVVVSSLHALRRLLSAQETYTLAPHIPTHTKADHILIDGLEVHAHIGVTDDEKKSPQRLEIDLTIEANLRETNDDLSQTTDYAQVSQWVIDYCADSKFRLLESLAEGVTAGLFAHFPRIHTLDIEIRKFILPCAKHTGIHLHRNRSHFTCVIPNMEQ